VMGLGMGFLSVTAIMIVQGSVGWTERGAATASNIFARNLGSTLGATALGAVFNVGLANAAGGAVDFERIRTLLDGAGSLAADALARGALEASLHLTFWGVFAIACATLALTLLVPRVAHATGAKPAAAAGAEPEEAVSVGH